MFELGTRDWPHLDVSSPSCRASEFLAENTCARPDPFSHFQPRPEAFMLPAALDCGEFNGRWPDLELSCGPSITMSSVLSRLSCEEIRPGVLLRN